MSDLTFRVHSVMARELEVVRAQLKRNNITMLCGAATFADPHTVVVTSETGSTSRVTAEHVLIACGTRPARTDAVPFDGTQIIDSDEILKLTTLPREMIVVGGGVIGLEYASMFSALGVRVCVVDSRNTLLDFADSEMIDMLMQHMRHQNATFRLGDSLADVRRDKRGRVEATLASNRVAKGDVLLYCVGRTTNADLLQLEAAGLSADTRGKIAVNAHYQTEVPHIYAAGDVIGFPALAATSMEQGRHSACHMFQGAALEAAEGVVPYGIYTIPEISMGGATEQTLVRDRVPYETGLARFGELARAQMMGVDSGILKVLFHRETQQLLGIHAFGDSATELIHIGQTAMALGGTMSYFRDAVFNYPTLAEAYKVAGLDGMNRVA
jgi:NAD(P) transhydrogenase